MFFSSFQKTKLKPNRYELGFTLPFVLILLVVLSITSIILIERVLNAQNLARLDITSSNQEIDSYKIEQDILWRALLELNGVTSDILVSPNAKSKKYLALEPKNDWSRKGEPIIWKGNYNYNENYFRKDPNITIEIRDAGGLIDINYPNEKYLLYIAERLGVPLGRRNRAVKKLVEELQNRSKRIDSENALFSNPLFTGLSDAAEICSIEDWNKINLCQNHHELREIVYAGSGNITNIDLASKEVTEVLLQETNVNSPLKLRRQWSEVQKDRGFGDAFLNLATGLETYIVTFHYSDGKSKQYLLDARIQPTQKPYALYLLSQNITQKMGNNRSVK